MSQPVLIIVAGCNGAGKSTFSKDIVHDTVIPFDYDKKKLEFYHSMVDSEFREIIANNKTTEEFESSIDGAFSNYKDFCYETNFDTHPIFWAKKAKDLGYVLVLHFFCIDSLDLAEQRVLERTQRKGHFVSNDVIFDKWKDGYKNLNLHYDIFDHVILYDNSSSSKPPQLLFSLAKTNDQFEVKHIAKSLPKYSQRRFPDIYQIIGNPTT